MGESWAQLGEPRALMGYFDGYEDVANVDQYVGGEERHPFYLYISAETFPTTATISPGRSAELERLLLQICPAHLYLVILVSEVPGPPPPPGGGT